jgi:CheY-like chemotaxis protein
MEQPMILLVDDEADLLNLFAMMLVRKSYHVRKAAGGPEAVKILENETPALILLDLAMPEVSGVDILHMVRADPRFEATRIIILTAVPVLLEKEDMQLIDGLLIKPVHPRTLEETVAKSLAAV